MTRGRKPMPADVAAQKRPVRSTLEPTLPSAPSSGASPSHLAPPASLKDPQALAYWNTLVPSLAAAKLMTPLDISAFSRYCQSRARWDKMQALLDDDGVFYSVTTASGVVHRAHPASLLSKMLDSQLQALEDRFGLNPSERQKIMANRAQTGVTGDLFAPPAPRREDDLGPDGPDADDSLDGPLGLLN